jgi:hypothetical protein
MQTSQNQQLSKKQQVLERLFLQCEQKGSCEQEGSYEFSNSDVKQVADAVGFRNPFDATKVDSWEILPQSIYQKGYCIAHIGRGRHRFIPELQNWYHDFEDISPEEVIEWRYRKSLLNDIDRGEASALSFAFNQHILHDFIYEDVVASPKIYVPGRSRTTIEYTVGNTHIKAEDQQLEMDLVLEYQGTVTVIEAKNKAFSSFKNFAVYQLFYPIKYYLNRSKDRKISIPHINACYVLRQASSRASGVTKVRLYLYEFADPDRLDSIRLVRKAEYHLKQR